MGNLFSKEKRHRHNTSYPSTSSSRNTQPAPAAATRYPYQRLKIDPRDQQQPLAKPTGKRRRANPDLTLKPKLKSHNPEYFLTVICSSCAGRRDCRITPDLNNQSMFAYRDPEYCGALKDWELRIDFCSVLALARGEAERAERALRKFTGDATYSNRGKKEPFCVDDLLRKMAADGVRVESSL